MPSQDPSLQAKLDARDTKISNLETGVGNIIYRRVRVTHENFTAAALTETVNVLIPHATRDAIPLEVVGYLVEEFAGGAVATATMQIGNDEAVADPNAYMVATNVFTGAGTNVYVGGAQAAKGVDIATKDQVPLAAGQHVTVTLTTTVANVVACTAGIFDVIIAYALVPDVEQINV